MTFRLYDTLSREKRDFVPIDAGRPKLYACGPTVYDLLHVGNGRPLVVFDVLYRLLRHLYGDALYVRNITDIDDKIIDRARDNGEPIETLTERTTAFYFEDAARLGCLAPDHQPRATDFVAPMIAMIENLVEKDAAYAAEGHVLFSVDAYGDYGQLSRRNRLEQVDGARVEVAPYKRDPADFVLWKPSSDDQPGWNSPWGRGRPGWHIECSAMSDALLGTPFDIHGGGVDLVFPHHENERAQSVCACEPASGEMANFWLHNGFVTVNGEKMAKSAGNFLTLRDAFARVPGEAVRYWILTTHYRRPIDCSMEGLDEAKAVLDRFYGALARLEDAPKIEAEPDPELVAALKDDLSTPKALAVLHGLVQEANKADDDDAKARARARLSASANLLGLLEADPASWLKGAGGASSGPSDEDVEKLIEARATARAQKDFARADHIRAQLTEAGVVLEDGAGGTTWRRK